MKEKIFFTEGRKLSYSEWGENNQRVLFCVHGLTRNAHDFDYLAKYMQDEFRIIAPNLAGHGESDSLEDYHQYHYKLFLKDILSLLDSLKINSIYWLGSSLGGIIGMYAFKERKNLLTKLILNDVGPQLAPQSLASLQNINIEEAKRANLFNTFEECRTRIVKALAGFKFPATEHLEYAVKYSSKLIESSGKYKVNIDPGVLSLFGNTNNVMRKEGLWDIWETIDIPVLEMWGRLSALLTPPIIEKMKATNSHLTVCACMSDAHVCNLIDTAQLDFIKQWLLGDIHVKDITLP